jgi:hypothetical protein
MPGTPHLLGADVPPLGAILVNQRGCTAHCWVTEGGRTTTGSTQVAGSGPTAAGSGFGYLERTCRMLRTPRLLGADVPPLGAILVPQSERAATRHDW